MAYLPSPTPNKIEDALPYIKNEFQNIATAIGEDKLLRIDITHNPPTKPRKGDVRIADGTDWNPGLGAGTYQFDGTTWKPLSTIEDSSVTTTKIADNAVTTVKLADNSVTLSKMVDNSVGTAELIDANVTLPKLAADTLTEINRRGAVGGYTKTFGGSAKHQYFQCIVINNRVFISGLLTYQIGNMPTSGVRQTARKTFCELLFNVQPPAGTTISKVSTSHNSVYVLLSNGWLYAFTYNNTHGLAGIGSTASVGCLTRIEYFVTNSLTVTNVWSTNYVYNDGAAGEPMASVWASCSNGNLYAWGNNGNGNLGIGSLTTPITTPTLVSGISNVIMLSAGSGAGAHVLAVSSNSPKSVYTWGYNVGGACGSGNTTDQLSPTIRYTDPTFDIQDVKAHGSLNWSGAAWTQYGQNSYILVNGTLKVCGTNVFGQLGQGNTTNLTTFTSVAGQSNITKMDNTEGSAATSYILKSDNTLWACGFGTFGTFGDGTTAQKNTYTQIQTGVSDFWCSGSSSAGTLFFKKTDGTFWGCGWNRYGQLCNALTEADVNSTAKQIPLPIGRTVSQVRFITNNILINAVGPWSGTAQAVTQENAYTGVLAVILDDGSFMCGGYNAENILSTGSELYVGQSPNTLAAYTRLNYLTHPIMPYQ